MALGTSQEKLRKRSTIITFHCGADSWRKNVLSEQGNPLCLFTFFQLLIFIHHVLGFSGCYFSARCSERFLLKTLSVSTAKCSAEKPVCGPDSFSITLAQFSWSKRNCLWLAKKTIWSQTYLVHAMDIYSLEIYFIARRVMGCTHSCWEWS